MKKIIFKYSAVVTLSSMILFGSLSNATAIDSSIDKDNISLKSDNNLNFTHPGFSGRNGGNHDSIQPVAPKTDEDLVLHPDAPIAAYKASIAHVPCGSDDASTTLALAPPDAPGTRTDPTTGQTYLCLAKTPNNQDPNPTDYTLPNGETITTPTPITISTEDFQNLGILPSTAHQERAPHTLKNYNTNFWATPQEQTFTIEMSGVPVEVKATPISYRYDYGDGEHLNTSSPGYWLGDDIWDEETPTSHKYANPGDYEFALTTYYRGEFSVAGGPWQVIEGTGEAVSEPVVVRVWRVKVGLVADDCGADPQAWGCEGTG